MLEIEIKKFLKNNEIKILNDLSSLIKIKSVYSEKNKEFPLGEGVTKAFEFIESLCKRDHFSYKNFDNYALEVTLGSGDKDISIFHHIDVVNAPNIDMWLSKPFIMKKEKRNLFGRGVNDNKGPLIYSYYMLKFFKKNKEFLEENNFQLKLIIGGAEETTWEGINYYKTFLKKDPYYAFSPDGNYPLVFLEKGILKLKLLKKVNNPINYKIYSVEQWTFICNEINLFSNGLNKKIKSKIIKSRNPSRLHKDNALKKLFDEIKNLNDSNLYRSFKELDDLFLKNYNGEKLGIKSSGKYGENSIAITSINLASSNLIVCVDIRYDNLIKKEEVINRIKEHKFTVIEIEDSPSHFVNPNSFLVKTLSDSYKKVSKRKEDPMYFSGKSYARAFKGCVSFGVSFPGENTKPHLPNETQNIDSLILSTQIISKSILSLINGRRKDDV